MAIPSPMLPPDFDHRLRAMAEVVVRIGVNLQPGQPLLITDPYELQGIHPEAQGLAAAIRSAALEAGCPHPAIEIVTSDPARLRALAETNDARTYDRLVADHIRRLEQHLARGGAFLFLTGSEPRLLQGLPPAALAQFDQIKWRHLGPLIQQLIRGASQWTLVPAPTNAWAEVAYADLVPGKRLDALWKVVFESFRVPGSNVGGSLPPDFGRSGHKAPPTFRAIEWWRAHLAALTRQCDAYNAARHRRVHYVGTGTDLTLELSRNHVWCTAQLVSKRGVPFVVNLPTEEIFTAPHRNSAEGRVRVARPVVHAGTIVAGITLEFVGGRVVAAHAETGQDLLRQLLATDDGANRLGEIAIVPNPPRWASVSQPEHGLRDWSRVRSGEQQDISTLVADGDIDDHPRPRCFHHTILDENAMNHIALGDAYRFCSRAWLPVSLNSSQIHVDLPLDAKVELS